MVIEILSYRESLLNPLLKWIILVLFIIAAGWFYRCRLMYGGKLRVIATLLMLGAIAGILASAFRIAGDYSVQWKWAESIFSLILAVITLTIAGLVRMKFKNTVALFEAEQEGEQR